MRLRNVDLVMTVVEDQTVILDTATSVYLTTNGAATLLLQALAEETTAERLQGLLQSSFGITPEAAQADCSAFLLQMREHGFLVE